MNVGIISMQQVINYGSFLQSYALKRMVEKEGVNVLHISPYSVGSQNEGDSAVKKYINELSIILKSGFGYLRHRRCWRSFKRKIIEAQLQYFKYSDIECYDMVVSGSDEVFNFCQEAQWDNYIFFGKGMKFNRICSFAGSCGSTVYEDLKDDEIKELKKLTGRFEAVSVRDENTRVFFQKLGAAHIVGHLDPVALYDFEDEIKDFKLNYKYMIVYSYNNRFKDKKEQEEIIKFAEKNKLKIIAVEGYQDWIDKYVACSPFELLSLFKNASYIVTDTFHGTVIASKYHKKFACYIRESNNNKLRDYVNRVDLAGHVIGNGNALDKVLMQMADYKKFDDIIESEKLKAERYISEIIDKG